MSENRHQVIERADVQMSAALHPIVEKILAQNPTPETLEKVLAIQREFEADQRKRLFTEALVNLKAKLPPFIRRDKEVDFTYNGQRTHYHHASLANVLDIVNPELKKSGFSLTFKSDVVSGVVVVAARLTHHAGHYEESKLTAAPDSKGNKNPSQAVGSTITALSRYAALGLLGIATADMDDENPANSPATVGETGELADANQALLALRGLMNLGKKKEEVEKYVGRPIAEWTDADVTRLREWWKTLRAPADTPATNDRNRGQSPAQAGAAPSPRTAGESSGGSEPQPEGGDLGDVLDFQCEVCASKFPNRDHYDEHLAATDHGTVEARAWAAAASVKTKKTQAVKR